MGWKADQAWLALVSHCPIGEPHPPDELDTRVQAAGNFLELRPPEHERESADGVGLVVRLLATPVTVAADLVTLPVQASILIWLSTQRIIPGKR